MRVQLIARPGPGLTGTSRYTAEICQGLEAAGADVSLAYPSAAPIPGAVQAGLRRIGLDAGAFFGSYPLRVKLDRAGVYHVTTQTMATLLWSQRFPAPVVVTVLDIIPYLVRHDPALNTLRGPVDSLFYRLALAGLRRADALIAISEYTKRTLVQALGLPPGRMAVVYPAVDHEKFHPLAVPDAFRARYGLNGPGPYLLCVGSDDPRKNLSTLVRAFALVTGQAPGAKLIKVGRPHFVQERERLLALVRELGLARDVLFFDRVPDADLPLFYNLAHVLVMPSLYEGFGLPALEAMACGTPVIASDRTALPEVVGDGGVLVDPCDEQALADAILDLLTDPARRAAAAEKALAWAGRFSLGRQAAETLAVYRRLL